MAIYQAYMEASIPGISANPALFTAINKDPKRSGSSWCRSTAAWQRMSDRAVRVITATDSQELRRAMQPRQRMSSAKFCPGRTAVGVRHDGRQHHLASTSMTRPSSATN